MTDQARQTAVKSERTGRSRSGEKSVAIGGLLAAITAFLAASCCVLPFVFIALGLGGSWLAFLDNGLLYREELQWVAATLVVGGWAFVLFRRQARGVLGKVLLMATFLLVASVLVWEFQGPLRQWLMGLR